MKLIPGKTKVRVEYTTEGKITKIEHIKEVVSFKGTRQVKWASLAEAGGVSRAGGAGGVSRAGGAGGAGRTSRAGGAGRTGKSSQMVSKNQWATLAENSVACGAGGAGGFSLGKSNQRTMRATRLPKSGEILSTVCYNKEGRWACVEPTGRGFDGKKIPQTEWDAFNLRYGDAISYVVVEKHFKNGKGKQTRRVVKVMGLIPSDKKSDKETKE